MQNFPPKLSQNAIIAEKFIINGGVIVVDPDSTWISPDISIGRGTIIYPNSYLIGSRQSFIGENCEIGPNAFIRDWFEIENEVKIGFNAEVVRSYVGNGTKIPHFCHVGDAIIGHSCNIAAGTVFCNYNGNTKQLIVIGNYVFVGSGANLIAPVTIADHAYIAAGAIVSKGVEQYRVVIGVNKVMEDKRSYYQPKYGWNIYPTDEHPIYKAKRY